MHQRTGEYVKLKPDVTQKEKQTRDLPGSPTVKTLPSNAEGAGSTFGKRAEIPHASGPEDQNIKQKQYCNKFKKHFKNGQHQKIKKKQTNPKIQLETSILLSQESTEHLSRKVQKNSAPSINGV